LFVDALLMVALRPNNYYSPCREERRGEERKRKESKQPGKRKLPPFARRLKPLTSAHPPLPFITCHSRAIFGPPLA
jgi:hypothetical protein